MPVSKERRWHDWFFRSHSQAELEEWTARMRFFRFHRAVGGLANDGDTLRCTLRVETEAELVALAAQLGITLHELPVDEPQPVRGKSYPMAEFDRFRRRMESFPRFQELGRITVASVDCSVHVWDSRLQLELSGTAGDPYEVTAQDVANAVLIEQVLLPLSDRVLPPPLDDEHCFHGS